MREPHHTTGALFKLFHLTNTELNNPKLRFKFCFSLNLWIFYKKKTSSPHKMRVERNINQNHKKCRAISSGVKWRQWNVAKGNLIWFISEKFGVCLSVSLTQTHTWVLVVVQWRVEVTDKRGRLWRILSHFYIYVFLGVF